jgi:hypothetical protein
LEGDSEVLWRLVGVAIERLAKMPPTVVEVASPAELVLPDLGWPRVAVEDDVDIPRVVQEKLRAGPVVVGPLWRQVLPGDATWTRLLRRPLLSEVLLSEYEPTGTDSVLGVVLPASTLTAPDRQALREAVAAHWRPAAVMYGNGLQGLHAGFQVAVPLLVHRGRQWPTIIFRVPADADFGHAEEDFRDLLKRRKGVQRGQYGYVMKSPLQPGESLQFDRHDPAVLERRADLGGYGAMARLSDLYEKVALGVRFQERADSCQPDNDGAVRVLSGRDIRRNGGILLPDEHSNWVKAPAEMQLEHGDIVLPRIFSASGAQGLVAVEVTSADLPAAAGDTVIWLRPRAGLSCEQRQFTLLYLQSELARTLALASSSSLGGAIRLSPSSLASLDVPIPDSALVTAIEHIQDAQKRLGQWRDEARTLLGSLFQSEGAEAQRTHIIESGRTVRSRAEAAALVDDPGYFVRTRFPHPLALRWRRIEAARAAQDWNLAYKEVREAGEVFTCYLALAALAMARSGENPIHIGAANQIRDGFKRGIGPGWGQWKAVLHEVGEIRNLPAAHPLRRMRELAVDEEATAALQRLYDRRNAESHLRGVDEEDLPPEVAEACADLTTLARRTAFLADWTLADVVTSTWDSLGNTATVMYRPMMGDHPIVSMRQGRYPSCDLEQGSLYIIDDDDRWHLLRPFLIGKRCAECKTWSTFHADMASDGKVRQLCIKSLEHGHVESGEWLSWPLEHVGLLMPSESKKDDLCAADLAELAHVQ